LLTIQAHRSLTQLEERAVTHATFTLGTASKAVNVSKSTVLRSIRAGRLSATRLETGDWSIAASELFRVFEPNRTGNGAVERHATADPTAALETEIAGLKQVADLLRAQLDETRRDRDKWADAATVALRALPPPAETRWIWWRSKKICK
jgi:excisionase family DNA binding protein